MGWNDRRLVLLPPYYLLLLVSLKLLSLPLPPLVQQQLPLLLPPYYSYITTIATTIITAYTAYPRLEVMVPQDIPEESLARVNVVVTPRTIWDGAQLINGFSSRTDLIDATMVNFLILCTWYPYFM